MEEIIKQLDRIKLRLAMCEEMIDNGDLTLDEQISTLDYHLALQNERIELENQILNPYKTNYLG